MKRILIATCVMLVLGSASPGVHAMPGMDLPGAGTAFKGRKIAFGLSKAATPPAAAQAEQDPAAAKPAAARKGTGPVAEVDVHEPDLALRVVRRVHWINPEMSATLDPRCAAPTCDGFSHGRARWPVRVDGSFLAEYRYNDMGRPAWAPPAADVRAAIRAGTAEWRRWNPSINIREVGTTTALPGLTTAGSCADGVNTIGWRSLGHTALGVTSICYDPSTMQIHDVDTALNSLVRWDIFGSPNAAAKAFDVGSIATHELGHWMSLHDIYRRGDRPLTMYGSALPGQTHQRTLALGDVLGARSAYPCGTACPPVDGIVED